jgi:hypothetical protein
MAKKEETQTNLFEGFELVSEVATRIAGASATQVDPVEQRRKRFLDGLKIQRQVWENPEFRVAKTAYRESDTGEGRRVGVQVEKMPRTWWRKGHNVVYMSVRYGARPVELQPGLYTARLQPEQVPAFFDRLEELTNQGVFDAQFEELSKRVRKN